MGYTFPVMLHVAFLLGVLVLALSFFGISIQAIVSSPAGQENIAYLMHLGGIVWDWILAQIQQLTQK